MSNLTFNLQSTAKVNRQNTTIKLLVFAIGKLTLALPILQVQKVIEHNQLHGSGLSHVNLTHLPEQEIAVVDLHRKLFKTSLQAANATEGFFIITKRVTQEALGIMVAQSPSLVDLPTAQIRLIPESYRRADTLEIASHVAVVKQSETADLTIFILDLEKLI